MIAKTASSEPNLPEALTARSAKPLDVGAFVALARVSCAEAARPFDERLVRYVFAGLERGDPYIHLLEAAGEVVGFAIVRHKGGPLGGWSYVEEDLLFVRADKRTAEAELMLHSLTTALFEALNAADVHLFIPPSTFSMDVAPRLMAAGFTSTALRMAPVRSAPEQPREIPADAASQTMH